MTVMNIFRKGYMLGALAALVAGVVSVSCIKEETPATEDMERRSLHAWMKRNRPDLLENRQATGEYYVEVLEWGDESAVAGGDTDFGGEAIMEKDSCWMYYNMTGRDMDGNVAFSRSESLSRMQNTFTLSTHYVPYLSYCGNANATSLLECTYLVTRNEMILGERYVADNSLPSTSFRLRKGSKVRIYSPSSIAYSSTGSSHEGGYEGQYAINANVPMILDIEVMHTLKNPSELELDMLAELTAASNTASGSDIWVKAQKIEDAESQAATYASSDDEDKNLKGLYYNLNYDPAKPATRLGYMLPYKTDNGTDCYNDSGKYTDMAALDKRINDILVEKFGEDVIADNKVGEDTLIGKDGDAKLWYVVRFLDGFVLDTNIPEIYELLFDEDKTSGSAYSYTPTAADTSDAPIAAWQYCIPRLHYGRWAAIATTSGYAYGNGQSGSTTTSSSSSSDLSYYNYYNDMYYNYLYGYNSMYYGGYYNYPTYIPTMDTSTTTTTTTTTTEIMAYTPLVFYVFVEPK